MVLMYLTSYTVFSALRIFALLEGKRILPGIILLFSLVAAALNAVCNGLLLPSSAYEVLTPISVFSDPGYRDI